MEYDLSEKYLKKIYASRKVSLYNKDQNNEYYFQTKGHKGQTFAD